MKRRETIEIESSPEPEETAVKVESPLDTAPATVPQSSAVHGTKRKREQYAANQDLGEADLEA